MKRSPLKKMSKKKAQQDRAFRILKPIYIRSHPYCEMFDDCFNETVDIHHMKGQAGELMCDEEWFKATCRPCHDWVETHKNKARAMGLILYK
jgi:hypothetical protein